jgi:hypothetical protein
VPNGQDPSFEAQIPHAQSRSGFWAPNVTSQIIVKRLAPKEGSDAGQDAPLTDTEKADLESGKAYIAVHGSVWYKDIFRKHQHWVKFCSWYGLRQDWNYTALKCTLYNSVDNN